MIIGKHGVNVRILVVSATNQAVTGTLATWTEPDYTIKDRKVLIKD